MYSRFFLVMAAIAALTLNLARADDASIASQLKSMDDSTLRDAGIEQAEQIRQIPNELRAQGIPVTAEQENNINLAADSLAANANTEGFKDRVVDTMKKAESGLKRAGIDSLKGIGYAGSSVFAASLVPFVFGTDLTSSLIFGKGAITVGSKNNVDAIVGYSGGLAVLYYVNVGLYAIGYTIDATVTSSAAGIYLVSEVVCLEKYQVGANTELDRYCDENSKIMRTILRGSASEANKIGMAIHRPLVKPVEKACDGIVDAAKWVTGHGGGSKTPCEPKPSPSPSNATLN